MKLTELKEITEKRQVTKGYKCDNCGVEHIGIRLPFDWHEFSAHHNSWGNDSVDSYEYYTSCSPECYAKLFQKAVDEFGDYTTSEIDEIQIGFAKRLCLFLNTKP